MSHTTRILAFAGSTRQQSFNRQLVALAAKGARGSGTEVSIVDLRDFALPLFDLDEELAHGLPEAARALKYMLIESHGLLIASPEYNSSVTGLLKNTIDWVSRPEKEDPCPLPAFRDKVVALMSASPGALGGLRGLVHLRSILGTLGCLVLPDQVTVATAHKAFQEDGSLADLALHQRVLSLGETLASAASKLHA